MNFIAFCLLLTLIDVSLTNELKFEDKIYPNLTKADGRYKSMDCTNKYGDFCDSDCSTLLTCHGHKQPIAERSCASINSGQPYCNVGASSCTSRSCSSVTVYIKCKTGLFYPDIKNCSQYHHCISDGYSQLKSCSNGYYFNTVLRECVRLSKINDCVEIDCTLQMNLGSFIVYKPNPMYFVYCSKDRTFATVYKCPIDGHVYVEGIGCQFRCTQEGHFKDPDNDSKYFECSNDCVWKQYHQTCMNNQLYNQNTGLCGS